MLQSLLRAQSLATSLSTRRLLLCNNSSARTASAAASFSSYANAGTASSAKTTTVAEGVTKNAATSASAKAATTADDLLRGSKFGRKQLSSSAAAAVQYESDREESEESAPAVNSKGVFKKIACIGTGKMAEAILQPMIEYGVQPAQQISVFDVSDDAMGRVESQFDVQTSSSIHELVRDADLVMCCVKPQNLSEGFYKELRRGQPTEDSIFCSIIAGKPISEFELKSGFAKIVRSMPNTPAMIGHGMTVWSCTDNLSVDERKRIKSILSSCGQSMYVDDESYIDMATSISGSGPAYIFMLMEAMIDAGVHMGFPRDKSATLVYHTMLGSTLYAMESKEHPAILRNSVTSPSGTTASAIYELENGKFRTVIKDAMWACYRRSLEMGHHDSNVGPGRTQTETKVILAKTDQEHSDDERNK